MAMKLALRWVDELVVYSVDLKAELLDVQRVVTRVVSTAVG